MDHRVAYQFTGWWHLEHQPCGPLVGRVVDEDTIDIPEESRPDRQPDWHEHHGDRKQMLVFIGQNMDEAAIRGLLDDCLLASPPAEADFADWEDVRTHSPHYRIQIERQLNPRIEPTST